MTRLIERNTTIPKDVGQQIETKDGLEKDRDQLVGHLASIYEPKKQIRLAGGQGAVQAASLTEKGSSQVRDFSWCWTSLQWATGSETAGGVPIKRNNTTLPECVLARCQHV